MRIDPIFWRNNFPTRPIDWEANLVVRREISLLYIPELEDIVMDYVDNMLPLLREIWEKSRMHWTGADYED